MRVDIRYHFLQGVGIRAPTVVKITYNRYLKFCIFQETRVTSLRDILELGVKDGKLKPSQLEFLDRQSQSH